MIHYCCPLIESPFITIKIQYLTQIDSVIIKSRAAHLIDDEGLEYELARAPACNGNNSLIDPL